MVAADGSENADQRSEQLSGIVGASVRERLLGELPDAFIRVQLRSVAGEADEVEAGDATGELVDEASAVGSSSIPEDEHMSAQVT